MRPRSGLVALTTDGGFADRIDWVKVAAALEQRHGDRRQPGARVVVWAHNSHLGDARATEMSAHGELRRPAGSRAVRRERDSRRLQYLLGNGDRRFRVGRTGETDAPAETFPTGL